MTETTHTDDGVAAVPAPGADRTADEAALRAEWLVAQEETALLLRFAAASSQTTLDAQLIDPIIAAREATRTGAETPKIRSDFWIAYNKLAHLVSPVTLDS